MKKNLILIVDDCPVYQGSLQFVVEKQGYTTETCEDGMKAMIRTNTNMDNVAAILLDIYMPEIDGISLLGHLRSKYPHIPVHIISGSTDGDDKMAALNLGAASFIPKPLTEESIAQLVASLKK